MTITLGMVFRPQFGPEALREVARVCDSSGVDELWLWEDCFDESGVAAAAAALGWTDRLSVGIGIIPVPLRNAAVTAMEIATLARLFPGRIHVGLGHGVQEWMDQVGVRAASPMTLMREYVAAVQGLLAGRSVTVDGDYVRLRDVQLGWPPATKPPLHVGAVRPRTIALAGELADGLVLTGGSVLDDVRSARTGFDTAWGDRPGRGRITTYLMAVHGDDARARYEAEVAHWKLTETTPHEDGFGVHGDAAAIADGVHQWSAAGSDAVILQPTAEDDPVGYARIVGEQVRPLL